MSEKAQPAASAVKPRQNNARPRSKGKRGWRYWLVTLHRELGFFAVGLTLIYAISGIAVNHRQHWDYNFVVDKGMQNIGGPAALLGQEAAQIKPEDLARQSQDALVSAIGQKLGRTAAPRKVFWRGPDRLSLFYAQAEHDVVDYHPSSGQVEWLRKRPRPLFRQLNVMHLNEARGLWTWLADGYALILIFLAISGVLVVKGRRGLKGRGGLWLLAGLIVPVLLYLWLAPSLG